MTLPNQAKHKTSSKTWHKQSQTNLRAKMTLPNQAKTQIKVTRSSAKLNKNFKLRDKLPVGKQNCMTKLTQNLPAKLTF